MAVVSNKEHGRIMTKLPHNKQSVPFPAGLSRCLQVLGRAEWISVLHISPNSVICSLLFILKFKSWTLPEGGSHGLLQLHSKQA